MELGNQIKKYRSELQISQEQLADRIYVSRQTISNWENEKSYPDVNSLVLLSEVFQTSIDKLIKGDIEIMKEKIRLTKLHLGLQLSKKLRNSITMVTFLACILQLRFYRQSHCSFGWNSLHLFRLEFFL